MHSSIISCECMYLTSTELCNGDLSLTCGVTEDHGFTGYLSSDGLTPYPDYTYVHTRTSKSYHLWACESIKICTYVDG